MSLNQHLAYNRCHINVNYYYYPELLVSQLSKKSVYQLKIKYNISNSTQIHSCFSNNTVTVLHLHPSSTQLNYCKASPLVTQIQNCGTTLGTRISFTLEYKTYEYQKIQLESVDSNYKIYSEPDHFYSTLLLTHVLNKHLSHLDYNNIL